ncbi:Arc family DNA-binding protein [Leisingera caerulea]|uniref:Arc family DNA-binding protein n=1 Tax=Leisingera caerulea TaxID=506591 RepID=UPI0021A80FF0|nr:Arc family DNA-binding protein [Leisingera caerulea]UWQ83526.1 Arc family DNA-binding protein [Leisingera caerulea]
MDTIASRGDVCPFDIMTEKRALIDKFMLRLPDGMRARIRAAAKKNGRSMNAEIVALLEDQFPDETQELPTLAEIEHWQDYIFEAEDQGTFENRLAWANAEIESSGWEFKLEADDGNPSLVLVLRKSLRR